MVLNREYYQKRKIYPGSSENEDIPVRNPTTHMLLETSGEYNFGGLNLIGYGWSRIHPINLESETIASVQDKKTFEPDYQRTLIFENKKEGAMAVMYLDMINHYHEIDLAVRNSPDKNLEILNRTKSMLERELKCKLEQRKIIPLESMDKIESN